MLRPACALALAVARDGASARPPVSPPDALGRVLGFARLSAPAYATIRRVVDEDEAFRARVAAAADEDEVGPAGWLWLTRPPGWEDQISALVGPDRPVAPTTSAERELARLRKALAAADERSRRDREDARAARQAAAETAARLAEADRSRGALESRLREVEAQAGTSAEERRVAVRALKRVEADLAASRRDLKVARAALVEAELQLARADAGELERAGPSSAAPGPAASEPAATGFELEGLRRAVEAASGAADELARALGQAGEALRPRPATDRDVESKGASPSAAVDPSETAAPRRRPRARRTTRRPAPLPAGRFEDSLEGAAHLLRLPGVIVLIDGYNVARTAWSGLTPEEERARLVTALEGLHARTGADVIVVFDGVGWPTTVPRAQSRTVKVRFSPDGVEADDVLRDLVVELPAERPVVVVSSDREVAEGARARGANALSSPQFLAAIGR